MSAALDPALDITLFLLSAAATLCVVYAYQVWDEEPEEDEGDDGEDGNGGAPSYREWALPGAETEGLWSALHYDTWVGAVL
jgi:hypothetical protein